MYHPHSEQLVDILINKTGSNDRHFFRVLYAFYASTISSMMRTEIATHDRGIIPVNMYALSLAYSGYGKNYASGTLEELMIEPFEEVFTEEVFAENAKANIVKLAIQQARKFGSDPDEVKENIQAEFESLGAYVSTFDSATSAAIKQLRKKLIIANAGSLNLIIDEIGSNLTGNIEALTDYLSLYDKGIIKQKITKSTPENKRGVSVNGATPANLLMFGTPSKLLNGAKTEEEFFSLLETGYARRLFFAFVRKPKKKEFLSPEALYEMSVSTHVKASLEGIKKHYEDLAAPRYFNNILTMSKETAIALLAYKQRCEIEAVDYKEHQEILKAELSHRYYKALKLAGTYAFVDKSSTITKEHLEYAIQLTEDSGEAFSLLMNRERNYVKLANYLASVDTEVTQVDLVEDLPFYSGTQAKKQELMNLAIAHGYKNNIVIKKTFADGIEFFKGEALKETNLDEILISWSDDIVSGYTLEKAPFNELHTLTQLQGHHFVNHELVAGYRKEDNCTGGSNIVVIDVDGEISLPLARMLLEKYKYHLYTTKRHSEAENRFRIIFPLSHVVKLDADSYKQFMENIFSWLPFEVDTSTGQRSRKWLTNPSHYEYNEGQLLDATLFIPKTKKAEERNSYINENSDLSSLERWFTAQAGEGSRNNMLLRYGYALVDKGYVSEHIRTAILEFNHKLPKPLPIDEIEHTIMLSVAKKIGNKE